MPATPTPRADEGPDSNDVWGETMGSFSIAHAVIFLAIIVGVPVIAVMAIRRGRRS